MWPCTAGVCNTTQRYSFLTEQFLVYRQLLLFTLENANNLTLHIIDWDKGQLHYNKIHLCWRLNDSKTYLVLSYFINIIQPNLFFYEFAAQFIN